MKLGLITPNLSIETVTALQAQPTGAPQLITIRAFLMPIARIGDYLANRSPQKYRELFNERIDFSRRNAHLCAMKTELQNELESSTNDNITLDKIMLSMSRHYLYSSNATEENECFKKRSSHIARIFTHLQMILP